MKKRNIILSLVLAFVLAISSVSVFYAEDPAGREDDRGLNIDPISISPSSVSINRGQSYQLNAILKPEYFGVEVNWSSSNTSVATIREGLVTGLSAGTATITAVMNELVPDGYNNFATCTVTVSSSGIIANGTYFIENVNAAKYVDVEGPSTSNGAKMQLWELTGATQRKWTVTLGTDGYYRIKSNYSNKYMRVTGSSSAPGATITQNSSIVSGSKWSFMITSAGNYAIIPACSATTLVVLNAPGTTNGYDLNTAVYSNNTDYKDEWKLTRMLPTNGSEITYGV
ncbi:MAG: RICIN domain-containing protein, partial [Clostridia bacterium]|nr:RICIN domain-containing protein [Clostridia bacterium]